MIDTNMAVQDPNASDPPYFENVSLSVCHCVCQASGSRASEAACLSPQEHGYYRCVLYVLLKKILSVFIHALP